MLKPMYTPGYCAPEQFRDREHLGPWSDIYSVGATMYACLAGSPPQRSDERVKKDHLDPALKRWNGQFSRQLLETIDSCLKLDPLQRPQSVYQLQKVLAKRVRSASKEPLPFGRQMLDTIGNKLRSLLSRT
jgi:serine/threonine protein kinase